MLTGDVDSNAVSARIHPREAGYMRPSEQLWQPISAAAADSRLFVVGNQVINSKTMAIGSLAPKGKLQWLAWCSDGLHAVMLLISDTFSEQQWQQLRVYHVASCTLAASLDCKCPDVPRCRTYPKEMYVNQIAGGARAVLVPYSQHNVSLCSLPSLSKKAELMIPELAGQPARVLHMGWADHDSHIAIVWQSTDQVSSELVVTVYSGLEGNLHQSHHIKLQVWDLGCVVPNMFQAFVTNPNKAAAAIAWLDRAGDVYVVLIDLVSGMQKNLMHPNPPDVQNCRIYCHYEVLRKAELNLRWSLMGQYLIVHANRAMEGCSIYECPSGEICGAPDSWHDLEEDRLVFTSRHPFCIVGEDLDGGDGISSSSTPAQLLPYFASSSVDRSTSNFYLDVHPYRCEVVPGTRNVIRFGDWDRPDVPICHWTVDPSTGRTVRHDVPGFDQAAGIFLWNSLAWQPTLKATAIYAVAEWTPNVAVHLIDAISHRRLLSWTSASLTRQLQTPVSVKQAKLSWSCDGKQLAIAVKSGITFIRFS